MSRIKFLGSVWSKAMEWPFRVREQGGAGYAVAVGVGVVVAAGSSTIEAAVGVVTVVYGGVAPVTSV